MWHVYDTQFSLLGVSIWKLCVYEFYLTNTHNFHSAGFQNKEEKNKK